MSKISELINSIKNDMPDVALDINFFPKCLNREFVKVHVVYFNKQDEIFTITKIFKNPNFYPDVSQDEIDDYLDTLKKDLKRKFIPYGRENFFRNTF